MVHMRGVLAFIGVAVAALLGLLLWSARRIRPSPAAWDAGEDWAGRMLVWLLVLAAFMIGAFVSFALLRP
jgi:hypothetical protein